MVEPNNFRFIVADPLWDDPLNPAGGNAPASKYHNACRCGHHNDTTNHTCHAHTSAANSDRYAATANFHPNPLANTFYLGSGSATAATTP